MQEIEKKRGGCLTAWLIFMLIANSLTALYYLVSLAIGEGLPGIPQWAKYILAVGCILNIVFAVAILRWKRWGVYGFGFVSIVAFIFNLATGLPIFNPIAALGLVGIIVLVILVRPVWEYIK